MRFFALIPAAGLSRRMGRPKLALPLGDRAVLSRVIEAAKNAGAHRVLVVLGPHVAALTELAGGADALLLPDETPDMRATVERGLDWLERECQPQPDDAWLLLPADHPTVEPSIIRQLIDAAEHDPKASMFVPAYQGRRGHPALIRWRLTAAIRSLPQGAGLNTLFHERPGEVAEVPTDSADVLLDMDTPEDYETLRKRFTEASSSMIVVRDLWGTDLESNGFVECLEALSPVGKIPLEDAREIYRWRLAHGCYTYVAVDNDEIVGTATLILERKFLHGGGWAGRVEEVAVRRDRQHQGIGTILMQHINQKAWELGCYKIVLCCTDRNVRFYELAAGYRVYDIGMRQDSPEKK